MFFDPLLKLNITSFSSIFELFCAFNFSYATIRPIREGIQKYFKDRLKDKLFKDDNLKNLLVLANELDTNHRSRSSLNFNFNLTNAVAVNIVVKLLNTITNSFDSVTPTSVSVTPIREQHPLFTEKTESLFLCFGFLSLVTLFIGGIANDYYTALSASSIPLNSSSILIKIKFWYMTIFMLTLSTLLYSLYLLIFRKPKDIEIAKTFLIYVTILCVSIVISYIIDYITLFTLSQSFITLFSILILLYPYFVYFVIPVYKTNSFVSELIIEIDENKAAINQVIESLSLTESTNPINNENEIPNFRESIQQNERQ